MLAALLLACGYVTAVSALSSSSTSCRCPPDLSKKEVCFPTAGECSIRDYGRCPANEVAMVCDHCGAAPSVGSIPQQYYVGPKGEGHYRALNIGLQTFLPSFVWEPKDACKLAVGIAEGLQLSSAWTVSVGELDWKYGRITEKLPSAPYDIASRQCELLGGFVPTEEELLGIAAMYGLTCDDCWTKEADSRQSCDARELPCENRQFRCFSPVEGPFDYTVSFQIFLSAAASASALFPPFARLDEDQFTVMFVDNLIRVLDEVGLPLTPMDLSHYVEEQLPATHYLRQFVIDFSNEGNVQQLWEAQQSYCTAVILEYLSCSADWIIETSMQAGSAVYRMAHKDADACTQLDEEEFADELMSGSVNELLRKAGVDLQIQVVRQLTFLDPDIEQPGPPVDRPPGNEYDPLSTTAPYVLLGCILAIAAAFAATRACRSSCVAQKKEKEPELQCRSEPDQPQPPDAYYPEEEVDEVVHHTVRLVRRTFAKNKDEQNDRKEVINAEVLQLLKALGISTMSHNPLNPS